MTVEEYERFVQQPENADKRLEYIGGRIVEAISTHYTSVIGAHIGAALVGFVMENDLGHVTGAKGCYCVSGERYLPSAAFISKSRQPKPSHDAYNSQPPDLAVEVVSPSDSEKNLRVKLGNYLATGTRVWVVYPETKEVEDYTPGQPVKIVDVDGALDGGNLLPGFKLAVKDVFPE